MAMGGDVHEFIAGDYSHPQAKEIDNKVDEILKDIKSLGYVPETDECLHEVEEEERVKPLHYHSEKLAVAFGVLKTEAGETLRISKVIKHANLSQRLLIGK